MEPEPHDLSPRARRIGVVAWASFLAACAGTMFFFAFVAPEDLLASGSDSMIDHLAVYTLGFFGLWLLGALASALTIYLSPTADQRGNSTNTPSQ
jgi:hypothetical protein